MNVKEGHDSKGKSPVLGGNRIWQRAPCAVGAQQTVEAERAGLTLRARGTVARHKKELPIRLVRHWTPH